MLSSNETKSINPDVIIIGAGPVGLWEAIKLLQENNQLKILMIERHKEYKRVQRLKLDMTLITNPVIRKKLLDLIEKKVADRIDEKNIEIPIQVFEKCLREYAEELGVKILYKRFITESQLKEEELEEKSQEEFIVGLDELVKIYSDCKLVIGADGSRSTVRQLLVDEKESPGEKKDLRNMIEVKYQVEGKVTKLSAVSYFLTQALLEGLLCSEHVKFNSEKNITEVTLRFIVDDSIYNDPRLKDVNAKNLLPLSNNIPTKLRNAINAWVSKRGDKNIILGSPTINKTKLSIFSSSKFCTAFGNLVVLLLGDASCNYPFMNGLNLGLEVGSGLATLIVKNFQKIKAGDTDTIKNFLNAYTDYSQAIFRKGSVLVNRANNKLTSNARKVDALYYSSYPIKTSMQYYYKANHEIFRAHLIPNLDKLINFVQKHSSDKTSDRYKLSNNLLTRMQQVTYDFDWIKSLLCLAYLKDMNIQEKEDNTSFLIKVYQYFGGKMVEAKAIADARCTLSDEEIATQKEFYIEDNQGSIRSYKNLDSIIADLYENIGLFNVTYKQKTKEMIRNHYSENATNLIEDYLFRPSL